MPTPRPATARIAALAATLMLAAACGSSEQADDRPSPTSGSPTTAVPVTSTSTAPPTTAPPTTAPPTTAPPTTTPTTVGAVMPDVVGLGLQVAQDTIQAAGVFYSRSFDCTGAGRQQVLDRNWVVVTQSPAPGTLIGEGDARLGVVKLDEPRTCT